MINEDNLKAYVENQCYAFTHGQAMRDSFGKELENDLKFISDDYVPNTLANNAVRLMVENEKRKVTYIKLKELCEVLGDEYIQMFKDIVDNDKW